MRPTANEAEVIDYFKAKADQYDCVDQQIYWVLSDTLLWVYFKKNILDKLPPDFKFLDAGGGTGRWTLKILEAFPQAQGVIYDLSQAMTNQAILKVGANRSRLKVINANLNDVKNLLPEAQFDLIFNFHNVLGFVDSPEQVLKDLSTLLLKNGYLVSLLPNRYHSLYFNLAVNAISEANHTNASSHGRFTANMPYMNLFTPQEGQKLYEACELETVHLTGFPNFIYPGMQETQLHGSTVTLENKLQENFDTILAIEMAHLDREDIAARGNNIFIAGQKTN